MTACSQSNWTRVQGLCAVKESNSESRRAMTPRRTIIEQDVVKQNENHPCATLTSPRLLSFNPFQLNLLPNFLNNDLSNEPWPQHFSFRPDVALGVMPLKPRTVHFRIGSETRFNAMRNSSIFWVGTMKTFWSCLSTVAASAKLWLSCHVSPNR